ncbi:MAG: UDP-N-acetylmuramoyl-tripeptide--D-alanyl-D-alanine ligase [Oscillospiraceae bacterium]|nr:UDP-N-acetylmuramoyl-tripeptide--D-alanyl-D-alanine ligase [Oscillospiraceae bacterium]
MKPIQLKEIARWCGGTVEPQYENIVVECVSTDSREVREGALFVPLVGANVDGHTYIRRSIENGARAALCANGKDYPDIPLIRVQDTLKAFGAVAAGYRAAMSCRVLGITGSVGKTTTKEMLAAILRRRWRTIWTEGNHNNQLGLPMTVMDISEDTEMAVLELGMNHFGEMSYLTKIARPDMAIFTNIGTMHIENLGSRESILRAKLEILEGMDEDQGFLVLNGDEPLLWELRGQLKFRRCYFGINNPACDVRATDLHADDSGVRFRAEAYGKSFEVFVPANGRHTVYDALAATAAALQCGAEPEDVAAGLGGFENTGMRQQIFVKNGYTILADCYNAGPESMAAALEVLAERSCEGRRIAVLGDMLELGSASMAEHYRVGRLAVGKADMIFAYGVNATRVATGAVTGGMPAGKAMYFDDQDQLVYELIAQAEPGDTLLFKGSRGMKMERALKLFLAGGDEEL